MKEIKIAYKCDFCGRLSATRAGMSRHEKCCSSNPANISLCKDCEYMEKTKNRVCDNQYGTFHTETKFRCTKKNINLYHPKVLRMMEYKRGAIIDGQDAEMMPTIDKGCPFHKFSWEKVLDFETEEE